MQSKSHTSKSHTSKSPALLWRRYRLSPTDRTRAALAEHYAHLAVITAQRLAHKAAAHSSSLDVGDLVGAAHVALMTAIDRFDHSRGVAFETYAIALMRGAVLEVIRNANWAPRSVQEDSAHIEATRVRLQSLALLAEDGHPPADADVAAALGMTEEQLAASEALVNRQQPHSLETALDYFAQHPGQNDAPATMQDYGLILDTDFAGDLIAKMRREAAQKAVKALPVRTRTVLSRRFSEGLPMKQIGQDMGISESRVYQICQQGLGRLRKALQEQQWD